MAKKEIDNKCPNCLSKLISKDGNLVCTGDRLKVWETDFKRYGDMNSSERREFLISFSDSERFVELHKKWAFVDEEGNRPNYDCGYTSKIFNPVPDNRIMLPDPLQVKKYERLLKRPLTEEELLGEDPIIIEGKTVTIKKMVFPDDF